jgi:hypothetical protein
VSKRSDEPGQPDLDERLRSLEERVAALEAGAGSSSSGRSGVLGRALRRGGDLEQRVEELESELQESRRLNMRLAELTDIVQELLLPMAQQDQELLADRLKRYSASL